MSQIKMNEQQNIIIYRTADGRASVALYAKDLSILSFVILSTIYWFSLPMVIVSVLWSVVAGFLVGIIL